MNLIDLYIIIKTIDFFVKCDKISLLKAWTNS